MRAMFPISTLFFEILLFSLPWLASVLIALRAHRSVWRQLTAFIPLLLSAVFVSLYVNYGWGILLALNYLVLTVPFVIAMIIATVLLRRFAPSLARPLGWLTAFLAISATLIFTIFTFVRQSVPDDSCAREQLVLAIGTTEIVVHPEMQPTIYSRQVPGSARLDGEWSGTFYGPEPRQKYGVRALCDAAKRGNGTVQRVGEFRVSPERIIASMHTICANPEAESRAYCGAGSLDVLAGISSVRVEDSRSYFWDETSTDPLSVRCFPNHDGAVPYKCTAIYSATNDVRITVEISGVDGRNEGVDLEAQVGAAARWLANVWMLDELAPADN